MRSLWFGAANAKRSRNPFCVLNYSDPALDNYDRDDWESSQTSSSQMDVHESCDSREGEGDTGFILIAP